MHKGSCLCGKIRLEIQGELPPLAACHCTKCRKISGHYGAGITIPRENLYISGEENITWYQSSNWVRRGFCSICGSSLFFDPLNKEKISWIGISMGVFDEPTNTHLEEHIFIENKGDYYQINDGLPQYKTTPRG